MQVPIIVFRLDCEPRQGRVSPPCRPPSPSPPGAPGQYCHLRHLLQGAALCPSIIPLPSHLEEKDTKILSSGNRQRCQRRLQGEERKSSDATMLLVRHSSFYSHHHGHHHSFISEFVVINTLYPQILQPTVLDQRKDQQLLCLWLELSFPQCFPQWSQSNKDLQSSTFPPSAFTVDCNHINWLEYDAVINF